MKSYGLLGFVSAVSAAAVPAHGVGKWHVVDLKTETYLTGVGGSYVSFVFVGSAVSTPCQFRNPPASHRPVDVLSPWECTDKRVQFTWKQTTENTAEISVFTSHESGSSRVKQEGRASVTLRCDTRSGGNGQLCQPKDKSVEIIPHAAGKD